MESIRQPSMKVGIVLSLGQLEHRGSPLTYLELRDRAQQAESLGFDSLWVYDHLLERYPGKETVGFKESWTILSALAEVTQKPELGTGVLSTTFRNPALLAKMADTLEEVSNGRLILGLGAGWHKPEFNVFGFEYNNRASRFEEALQIIKPLLRDGYVDFRGKYYQAQDCELKPHTKIREGGPPLMIASFQPKMLHLTAQYAQGWITDWLGGKEHFNERKQAIINACLEVGRNPPTLELIGGVTIAYPELGPLPSWMTSSDQYFSGSPQDIAKSLDTYRKWGVSHIMCSYYPDIPQSLNQLGQALDIFRTSQLD